ncbi:MAG: hypothetical protein AABW64_01795 [Nanoarchaeota archaeon]
MSRSEKGYQSSKKKSYTLLIALLILVVVVLLNESPYLSGKFVAQTPTRETLILSCSSSVSPIRLGQDLAREAGQNCVKACNAVRTRGSFYTPTGIFATLQINGCSSAAIQSLHNSCTRACQALLTPPTTRIR